MADTNDHYIPFHAESLIQRYLDGVASDTEVRELSALVESDNAVAESYVRFAHLHAALWATDELLDGSGRNSTTCAPSVRTAPARSTFRAFYAIATCVIAVLVTTVYVSHDSTLRVRSSATNATPFATIGSALGVEGLTEQHAFRDGWQQLSAGTLKLSTRRNVRLAIEAPARFRFESTQRLNLAYGRLTAEVPSSAKGFTVVTPSGKVVDLGTKFGIDVASSGHAEVHVFQGEVIAHPVSGSQQRSIVDGEALLLEDNRERPLPFRSSAFIQPAEVVSLHAGLAIGQQQRSITALAELAQDPAFIALFDFEDEAPLPGKYRLLQGRWPGSHAPDFVEAQDHIKVNIKEGQHWNELTLTAWVRLEHLGAPFQSIIHTNGWGNNNPGQMHWMVRRRTVMRLGIFGNSFPDDIGDHPQAPDSQTALLPEHDGWLHLATVYNATQKTVRFYLNGKFDNEVLQATALPAVIGSAQIGNWDGADRRLNGRIDELLIIGRALQDEEILSLYKSGNPYHSPVH